MRRIAGRLASVGRDAEAHAALAAFAQDHGAKLAPADALLVSRWGLLVNLGGGEPRAWRDRLRAYGAGAPRTETGSWSWGLSLLEVNADADLGEIASWQHSVNRLRRRSLDASVRRARDDVVAGRRDRRLCGRRQRRRACRDRRGSRLFRTSRLALAEPLPRDGTRLRSVPSRGRSRGAARRAHRSRGRKRSQSTRQSRPVRNGDRPRSRRCQAHDDRCGRAPDRTILVDGTRTRHGLDRLRISRAGRSRIAGKTKRAVPSNTQ